METRERGFGLIRILGFAKRRSACRFMLLTVKQALGSEDVQFFMSQ